MENQTELELQKLLKSKAKNMKKIEMYDKCIIYCHKLIDFFQLKKMYYSNEYEYFKLLDSIDKFYDDNKYYMKKYGTKRNYYNRKIKFLEKINNSWLEKKELLVFNNCKLDEILDQISYDKHIQNINSNKIKVKRKKR